MVGPALPLWAHHKSVTVPNPNLEDKSISGSITLRFYSGTIQENFSHLGPGSLGFAVPDILVGLNAGLGAYSTWMHGLASLRYMMQVQARPEIQLFTDYIQESVEIDRTNLYVVYGPLRDSKNLYEGNIQVAGYHGERDISSRIHLSETVLNPFRKPIHERDPSNMTPLYPNGFACWVELDT